MKIYEQPGGPNPLQDKKDMARNLTGLLDACLPHLTDGDAGLFLDNTRATYSSRGTLLEGWSRLLWGLAPLQAGGFPWEGAARHASGLCAGTDPQDHAYWGDVGDYDQRMVEMAAIALSLLLCPDLYWDPLSSRQKDCLIAWLSSVNRRQMPRCNWIFFRILVNLAFEKLGRDEYDKNRVDADFATIDGWYRQDGWYVDEVQFDYYNPFGFQYYSLLYYAFKKDEEVARCNKIRDRVFAFAKQFVNFFDAEGAAIPYGRSLTYRMGMSGFFSACAFAGLEVLPWGEMKGIVLRNLRWWFDKPMLDRSGIMTIGYAYPSLPVADYYNSPGSPYWGLKTYLVLALDDSHPFWRSEELPLPVFADIAEIPVMNGLIQRTGDGNAILLNGGQYPVCHHMHVAEKYAKFAYSTHYGFSASSSYFDFEMCGCDNMLYFSEDGHYWRPRRESEILHRGTDYLLSRWHPFKDVTVLSYIIPYGDCHIRVHKIRTGRAVQTKEGGFAIARYRGMEQESDLEVRRDDRSFVSVALPWDVSAIGDPLGLRETEVVSPTPNLNLMAGNTVLPVLSGTIGANEEITYITCVGARRNDFGEGRFRFPSVTYDHRYDMVRINDTRLALDENL